MIASPEILSNIVNFVIDIFDPLLSDVHNPLCLTVLSKHKVENANKPKVHNDITEKDLVNHVDVKVKWNNDNCNSFKSFFDQEEIQKVMIEIESLSEVNSLVIDNINAKINKIIKVPAEKSGMLFSKKQKFDKCFKKNNTKPWFDKSCKNLRAEYFKSKNKFRKNKDPVLLETMNEKCKEYKKHCKKKKRNFYDKLHNDLRLYKVEKPRDYWKILNKTANNLDSNCPVPMNVFVEHFRKLNTDDSLSCEDSDFNPLDFSQCPNEYINNPFSLDEVKKQCNKLKNNKACGVDFILNEFIKNSTPDFLILLTKYFNIILDTGIIPTEWCMGMIQPIFKKKGSITDPDNYRGITLLSCMSKMFTALLNNRLKFFLESSGTLDECQTGFRDDYSTLDHIFTLHSLIELYLVNNKRIYCAFIDYRKAFDLINRSKLWLKLLGSGINGKVLNVIHNLYSNAKSCIKNGNSVSKTSFMCNVGVRQGEILSPVLFALYLNDFEHHLSKLYKGLDNFSKYVKTYLSDDDVEIYLRLYCLLYADDTIVMAENPEDLQTALDGVYSYCNDWNLTVNTSKTEIVIFSRGKVKKFPKCNFGEKEIEVTDDYVYLGCTFNYNNKFNKAISKQTNQAKRAMYSLLSKCIKLNLPLDIALELFDSLVSPILLYGCEIWGCGNCKAIESLHVKFCKIILKINKNSPNCMALGELGRLSTKHTIDKRIIGFWCRLITGKQSKLSTLIYNLCKTMYESDIYEPKWMVYVKKLINNCGFSYFWDQQNVLNTKYMISSLHSKIDDLAKQEWLSEIFSNKLCSNYRIFKCSFGYEKCLNVLNVKERLLLSKFRCGNHKLPINTSRYIGVENINRICTLCNYNDIGDEFHYLFKCSAFVNERKQYISSYHNYRPNTIKMCNLMNMKNKKKLLDLIKFIAIIMKKF